MEEKKGLFIKELGHFLRDWKIISFSCQGCWPTGYPGTSCGRDQSALKADVVAGILGWELVLPHNSNDTLGLGWGCSA